MDRRVLRLVILGAIIVATLLAAYFSGLTASFSQDKMRSLMLGSGVWGIVFFFAAFAVGELLHIPGLVFVGGAVLAFGRVEGGILAYCGALISISVAFFFIRAVGGQPLGAITNKRVQAALAKLEHRPIVTVVVVRTLTWLTPAFTYVLALSNVRYRAYLIGSAIGLVIPIALLAAFFGIFFH